MPLRELNCPPRLPQETWWQIVLYLPKPDLWSLLFVSSAISRIASQLLFRKVDLRLHIETEETDDDDYDAWHDQRDADILTRILADPYFAGQVRNLRISVYIYEGTPALAFTVGILMNALSKLLNLHKVHCIGTKKLITRVLQVVHSHNPRLQRLFLELKDKSIDIEIPVFKHLTHFGINSYSEHSAVHLPGGRASSLGMVLEQSRGSLRYLSIKTSNFHFLTQNIYLGHLTQIEINDCSSTDSCSKILANGHQLESLRLSGTLICAISSLFRRHHTALPLLRHFSLTINCLELGIVDADLCPAISAFLWGRTQLRTYELIVQPTVASGIGFDASAWGVLPGLSNLTNLAISFPKDLPPSLAGWLVPRTVRALTLDLWILDMYSRDSTDFVNKLRLGMPPLLCYIGIDNGLNNPVLTVIEHGFPNIRVARIDEIACTVTRSSEDNALKLEEWPLRIVERHAGDWLDSLGCADAIWDGVDEMRLP